MTKRNISFLLLLLAVGIFTLAALIPSTAYAATSDCSLCHGTVVSDFKLSLIDKTKTCGICHNGGGHAYWYDENGNTVYPVYIQGLGYFKTADTVNSTPGVLHQVHSGQNGLANNERCYKCHGVASCSACHNNVSHINHSTTKYVAPSFEQADGSTYISRVTSCALSECHVKLPNVVRYRSDGSQLCLNCHSYDKSGHTEESLAAKHSTTFTQTLIPEANNEPVNCSNCHNNDLRTEHFNNSNDCTTCHSSTTPAEVKAVVDSANGVEANRACEKCHFNMAVLPTRPLSHPLYHVADKSNGLSVVGGPHTSCNTCHDRAEIQGTIKTLAYSSVKDYSCLDCHTGGSNPKAPVHKAEYNGQPMAIMDVHTSCATCHTPGTTYAAKVETIAAALKADPSATYSCTECHDGTTAGHKATFEGVTYNDTTAFHLACTDCHNDTYKSTIASLKEQVKLGLSYDCAACHSAGATKGVSPYYPVHQAGNDAVVGFHPASCNTCHGVVNGKYSINLDGLRSKLPAPGYACTDCHNGTVTESGLVANAPYHKAQDDKGTVYVTTDFHPTCGTCHDSADANVVNTINTKSGTTTPYLCADCHTGGLAALHNAKWTNGTAYETTQFHKDCAQCHANTNQAVTDKIHSLSGSTTGYNCTDCHNGQVVPAARHAAKLNANDAVEQETTQYHLKLSATAAESCFQCHNNDLVAADMTAIFSAVKSGNGYLCTDCHNNGTSAPYTPNHSAVLDAESFDTLTLHPACTTCHTTAADTNIRNLKGQTGYECQVCHGDVSAKHTSPTVLTGGMITCAWCHSSDLVTSHLNPPVQLAKTMQCTTCHGAASPVKTKVELGQKDCFACHDGVTLDPVHPGKQYVPRHLAVFPEFLPEYSPNCVTCHYNGTLGSVPTVDSLHSKYLVGCGECHNDTTFKPAVTSLSTNCAGCHDNAVKPGMDMTETHKAFHNADTAKYPATAGCLECHAKDATVDGQSLLGVHKKNPNSTVTCDTCHGANARAEVKAAVAANDISCQACHANVSHNHDVKAYEANTDVNCVNCHATDSTTKATELSKLHSKYGKDCSACHTAPFETAVIAKDGTIDMLKNGTEPIYCSTCHNGDTANGYPATRETRHAPEHQAMQSEAVTCSTCHDGTTVQGSFNIAANTPVDVTGIHSSNNCNTCHDNANVQGVISAKVGLANGTYNCTECHDGTKAKTHNKLHTVTAFTDDGATGCTNCHNADVTVQHSESFKAGLNCDTCHGTNAANVLPNTPVVIKNNLSTNASRTGYTCTDCHGNVSHQHKVAKTGYQAMPAVECSTCHATNTATGEAELYELHSKAGIPNFGCATCHNSTFEGVGKPISGDKNLDMMRNGAPIYCTDCHNGSLTNTVDSGHQPEHKAKHGATGMSCNSCHGFTVAAGQAVDIKSAEIHPDGCNTCHSGAANTPAQQKALVMIANGVGKTNPEYNCEDCHGTIHLGWDAKHRPTFPADPNMNCANCHDNYLPAEHTKALTAAAGVGYEVFRSTSSSGPWTSIGTTTATAFADTGLAADTTYYYKVRAYDGKPNYSGFSNVVSVKTMSNTPVITTQNPDLARYASGNNGDSSSDPSSTTDVLSKLTDNSNSTYSTVKENGSSDQYIFVQVNKDAKDYTKVELKMSVRYYIRYYNGTNLTVYPYNSDGTSINTGSAYIVDGPARSSSSSFITETIDVTKAAQAMSGFGWMKFRIKPDPGRSASVYIADVQLVLTQNAASGGSVSNPPGDLSPNSGDTVAPSVPTGLTARADYYDRVDLSWTASTDTGGAGSEAQTCALCHSSAAPDRVKTAVQNKNANCSACHDIHGDIATVHTAPDFGFTSYNWNCSKCHSAVLTEEHAKRGLNCATCHDSAKAKVRAAIDSTATDGSNRKCSNCHTGTADGAGAIHTDIATPHLTGIFPTATDADCLNCHDTQKAEFADTRAAYHVVAGLTSKASGYGKYISPWTATSVVGCKGCHGDNNDGKAQQANILKRPYTYTANSGQADMLCFLCHDRATYGYGGSSSGTSGFSEGGKNLHNIGDHKVNGVVQCSWCHAAVPHGTAKAHLIVTKSDPNSAGNLLTNFTHPASGNYSKRSCGSDSKQCDDHKGY